MQIDLRKLNYSFHKKPLLIGGKAMEYYELRKAGNDIDFIASEIDVIELIKKYPDKVKNLYSDLGVCPYEFEIWRSIQLLKYEDLLQDAIEEDDYFVISLEKLLLLKALGIHEEKYLQDTKFIVKKINQNQYRRYDEEKKLVHKLIEDIGEVKYIEKS